MSLNKIRMRSSNFSGIKNVIVVKNKVVVKHFEFIHQDTDTENTDSCQETSYFRKNLIFKIIIRTPSWAIHHVGFKTTSLKPCPLTCTTYT